MVARNPYLLDRPAVVSFSGGRTSGYMLWHILQAFGGTLPDDVKVLFANTGKERLETLDFVEWCGVRWGVPIVWLEYRFIPAPEGGKARGSNATAGKHTFEVVSYATASRKGEPFEDVIRARNLLPTPVMRFCTAELKIRTMYRYLRSLGWSDYTNALGLRADEPHRVSRSRNPDPRNAQKGESVDCPLATAGVSEADVLDWWSRQEFDLALKSHEGNCDLCFLKSRGKLAAILRDHPELADWWVRQEEQAPVRALVRNPSAALFRKDRANYRQMLKQVQDQPELPFPEEDNFPECRCTD